MTLRSIHHAIIPRPKSLKKDGDHYIATFHYAVADGHERLARAIKDAHSGAEIVEAHSIARDPLPNHKLFAQNKYTAHVKFKLHDKSSQHAETGEPVKEKPVKGHVTSERARQLMAQSPIFGTGETGEVGTTQHAEKIRGLVPLESVHAVARDHGFHYAGHSTGAGMHVYIHPKEKHVIMHDRKNGNTWHFLHGNTPHGPGDMSGTGHAALKDHLSEYA